MKKLTQFEKIMNELRDAFNLKGFSDLGDSEDGRDVTIYHKRSGEHVVQIGIGDTVQETFNDLEKAKEFAKSLLKN